MSRIDQATALAARLYQTRGADLLRYLRHRLRSDADAKDIAQEAYLRFIRLSDPDRLQNPEAYLFRIAGNLLWEQRLREQGQHGQTPLEDTPVTEHTPFDFAASGEAATRLHAVLDTLPVLPRSVLILHLRDGLTCAEIGAQAGISASMVKKHLHKAVVLCRKRLRDFKADSGAEP
ncbi:MAG: RNA polymerase sigma factor [Steroidobacteraceae bacterium]